MQRQRSEHADHEAATSGVSPFEALPGLATAFDEERMKGHLGAALFGRDRARHSVEQCTPTRPLYIPGDSCLLRYRFRATDEKTGAVLEPIVTGRVFPDRSACASYMDEKLVPLVARMHDRPETAAFVAPAAMIDELSMVVQVWPVDGELPTLVQATDRRAMTDVLRQSLPEAQARELLVEHCRIELVSYRRRQRCVLRYVITGSTRGTDEPRPLVVYGKVSGVGDETLNRRIIEALRDRIGEPVAVHGLVLPRPLAVRPELRLTLLEALPGEARIGPALTARLRQRPAPEGLPLERMVETAGRVAAVLHTSRVALGPVRTLDDELAGLLRQVELTRQFLPAFADRAGAWLERIAARAAETSPLALSVSHGDFKHEQLLFDGSACGIVDLDGVCQAEPALDLGKFLAHLRTEAQKIQGGASFGSLLVDALAEQFLGAYVGAAGDQTEDEAWLRARTMLYEAIALLRLALLGAQDLDQPAVDLMTDLLEARMSAIAAGDEVDRQA